MHVSEPSDARSPRRRLPTASACALLALAAPGVVTAQASAAAISVPEACVVNTGGGGSPMVVQGSGFTPSDSIELTTDKGSGFGTVTVGPTGSFLTTMTAPVLSSSGPAEAIFKLTANDNTTPLAINPTTSFLAANLAVATNPARARPGKKVTFIFTGFVTGKQIYAHYLHGRKITATARFGKAGGPCGVLKKKAKLYPSHQRYTSYKVQFDDLRHYTAKSLPRYVTTLSVFTF
jgi:hypothetical protein